MVDTNATKITKLNIKIIFISSFYIKNFGTLQQASVMRMCLFILDSVPDGLAVDWKSKLLFYTDTGEDVIVKMDYDGDSVSTLITSVDEPRAIVLDFDSQ